MRIHTFWLAVAATRFLRGFFSVGLLEHGMALLVGILLLASFELFAAKRSERSLSI